MSTTVTLPTHSRNIIIIFIFINKLDTGRPCNQFEKHLNVECDFYRLQNMLIRSQRQALFFPLCIYYLFAKSKLKGIQNQIQFPFNE